MRRLVVVAVGPIEGISAGLLLSELVGVVGFLLFERAVGVRFLPVVLGTGRCRGVCPGQHRTEGCPVNAPPPKSKE